MAWRNPFVMDFLFSFLIYFAYVQFFKTSLRQVYFSLLLTKNQIIKLVPHEILYSQKEYFTMESEA